MKRTVLSVCILALALILTACSPTLSDSTASGGEHTFHYGGDVTLRILSGSENQELGFVGTEVSVSGLLSAIQSGKLNFCMTSATHPTPGAALTSAFSTPCWAIRM